MGKQKFWWYGHFKLPNVRDIPLTWDISQARYFWECSLAHWNLIRHFEKHSQEKDYSFLGNDTFPSLYDALVYERKFKSDYYTSHSLWRIWLVESIQSIHNSLWTWHDKCNICCRYCIYHVKFNVCQVTNLLRNKMAECFASVSEDELCEKCILKQLLNSVFAWCYESSKPRVCVICLILRLRQITQTSVLIIHDIILSLLQYLIFGETKLWAIT